MTKRKQLDRLSLLGKVAKVPDKPRAQTLETFPNPKSRRDYWIIFESQEFTSMCPVTGQPDFAKIHIEYVPNQLCIETKSLKFYLAAFRNTRAFNEAIVNQILDDIVVASRPRRAIVHGEFVPRGGISVSVVAGYPNALSSRARTVPEIRTRRDAKRKP